MEEQNIKDEEERLRNIEKQKIEIDKKEIKEEQQRLVDIEVKHGRLDHTN